MIVKEPPELPVRDDVEAVGVDPEALIEEARRHQRQRTQRRNVALGFAALLRLLGIGIDGLLREGHGVQARSPDAAPLQRISSGLLVFSRIDAGESHITVVDPSGRRRPRDLGPGAGPRWSPDGRKLVFGQDIGGLGRIFVMNADGSGRHPLPIPSLGSRRYQDWEPAWSPDGRRIAFTRTVWPAGTGHDVGTTDLGRSAVYVFDLADGGLRRVSSLSDSAELPASVTWSPDGRRLAYLADRGRSYHVRGLSFRCTGLHVINADGTGDHVVGAASRLPDTRDGCVSVWAPAWSPDGHWIAFARSSRSFRRGVDLYLVSPSGKHLHRLTHQPNLINDGPTWSADGKWIAFVFGRRDRGGPGPGGQGRIHPVVVIDRDGSNRHPVTSFRGHIFGGADWQTR